MVKTRDIGIINPIHSENKDSLRNNDSLSLQFNKFIESLMVFEKKQSCVKSTFIKCIPAEIITDN